MHRNLKILIREMIKASVKRTLFTDVPKDALKSIMDVGLLSAKKLINEPELLNLSRPNKKDREEWIKKISKIKEPFVKGPNAYIKPPPKNLKLSKDHPSKKYKTVRVEIDIDKLLEEEPDTKFYGLELTPFPVSEDTWNKMNKKDQDKLIKDIGKSRERFITLYELDNLLNKDDTELWSHYDNKSSLYAGDVPHVAIITPNGIIEPKFLKIVK